MIWGFLLTAAIWVALFPKQFLQLVTRMCYRLKVVNHEVIPTKGAGVIIANHVSFIDWLFIVATCKRKVYFVIWYKFFEVPLFGTFLKMLPLIPIAGQKENFLVYEKSFQRINQLLDQGQLICIFPEGKITYDGKLNKFKSGLSRILTENDVPLYGMVLKGLWGSFFSRKYGAFKRITRFYSKIEVTYRAIPKSQWKNLDDLEQMFREELTQEANQA